MLLLIGLDRFLRSQRELYTTEALSYFLGESHFLWRVVNPAQLFQVGVDETGKRVVGKNTMVPVDHLPLDGGSGAHSRSPGCLQHPLPDPVELLGIGVTDVVVNFRALWDHVGSQAALGDHIMDPCLLGYVFP